jgi:hypothetical protein
MLGASGAFRTVSGALAHMSCAAIDFVYGVEGRSRTISLPRTPPAATSCVLHRGSFSNRFVLCQNFCTWTRWHRSDARCHYAESYNRHALMFWPLLREKARYSVGTTAPINSCACAHCCHAALNILLLSSRRDAAISSTTATLSDNARTNHQPAL